MATGDLQGHLAQRVAAVVHGERRGRAVEAQVGGAHVGAGGLPHADHASGPARGPARRGRRRRRRRRSRPGSRRGRSCRANSLERGPVGLLGAPVVEVVGLDVGDDRGVRPVVAGRRRRSRRPRRRTGRRRRRRRCAGRGEVATDGVRRVGAGRLQRDREQRGRRGLAVGAGHGEHPAAGHHRGERRRSGAASAARRRRLDVPRGCPRGRRSRRRGCRRRPRGRRRGRGGPGPRARAAPGGRRVLVVAAADRDAAGRA